MNMEGLPKRPSEDSEEKKPLADDELRGMPKTSPEYPKEEKETLHKMLSDKRLFGSDMDDKEYYEFIKKKHSKENRKKNEEIIKDEEITGGN